MAGDVAHLTDSGIQAGSQEGITLIVILIFLSISLYKYASYTCCDIRCGKALTIKPTVSLSSI